MGWECKEVLEGKLLSLNTDSKYKDKSIDIDTHIVKMIYLTSEIEEQFKNIVEEVDWLSESTKETARNKLDAMIHNIGYPDLVLNDTELSEEINGVCFVNIWKDFKSCFKPFELTPKTRLV